MKRADVLRMLRANEPTLRQQYFVKSLALFGSVARDEATPNSDVDLLVEFERRIGLFHLVGTAQYIEKLLNLAEDKVDLVLRRAVLPELQGPIFAEAIDVFDTPVVETADSAHP
jgi:predicted nucleotidyltransferase